MRYVNARLQDQQETLAYRIYCTRAFQAITINTSGENRSVVITKTLEEVLFPDVVVDNRTADEIKDHFKQKLGG